MYIYIYISNRKAAGKGDSRRTEQRNEAAGLKATYVVYPTEGKEITAPMLLASNNINSLILYSSEAH